MDGYTLGDAARILKVSPARLRYWERTSLVASRDDRSADVAFEFRDLVGAKKVLSLLDQGVPLRRIRRSLEDLRHRVPELADPLVSLRLWQKGSARVVVRHEGVLLEPDGQTVLDFAGAPTHDVVELATEPDDAAALTALDWFERGCHLDAEPATQPQAIEAYRRAIALDPEFADAHCNLGAVLYNRGGRAAARRCFEHCLTFDPRHVEGHFNLANLLEEDGCYDMALRHYREALASDPLYADVHVNLALLYQKLGMALRSRDHWRRYLQLDASGPWAQVARQALEEGD